MLTVMCAKSLARLKHRQRALEDTRETNAASPELSAKALTSAPDFWDRQHSAFAYVDSKIQGVKHSARFATGLLALALVADAGLILGGIGLTKAFQRWQTARKLRPVDPVAEQIMLPADESSAIANHALAAEHALDPVWAPQQRLQYGDVIAQKTALMQLAVLRDDPRVVNILAEVAQNDIDYPREVRQLAVQLLVKAPDARTTALQSLLGDPDPRISTQALAALSALPSQTQPNSTLLQRNSEDYQSYTARHRQSTLAQINYWGRSRSTQHVPALIRHLSDRDASVRESAALALAEIDDSRAWIPLQSRLNVEQDPNVRRALARSIGRMARLQR